MYTYSRLPPLPLRTHRHLALTFPPQIVIQEVYIKNLQVQVRDTKSEANDGDVRDVYPILGQSTFRRSLWPPKVVAGNANSTSGCGNVYAVR
jgi:hypothetical protein